MDVCGKQAHLTPRSHHRVDSGRKRKVWCFLVPSLPSGGQQVVAGPASGVQLLLLLRDPLSQLPVVKQACSHGLHVMWYLKQGEGELVGVGYCGAGRMGEEKGFTPSAFRNSVMVLEANLRSNPAFY